MTDRSRMSGTKPAPMPWILCGPDACPESTAEVCGSTAIILQRGICSRNTWPTPGTGVARGGLDDPRLAGREAPLAPGRLDHRQREAVLDGAARVELLALDPHLGRAGVGQPPQLDERRAADELEDGVHVWRGL